MDFPFIIELLHWKWLLLLCSYMYHNILELKKWSKLKVPGLFHIGICIQPSEPHVLVLLIEGSFLLKIFLHGYDCNSMNMNDYDLPSILHDFNHLDHSKVSHIGFLGRGSLGIDWSLKGQLNDRLQTKYFDMRWNSAVDCEISLVN